MQHFLDEQNFFRSTVPLGDLGVRLFFVLSGFLITGILLQGRDKIEHSVKPSKTIIFHFFIRRAMRLMPIYYLVLIILIFSLSPDSFSQPWWFLTYLQNIHFALQDGFTTAKHFWTLAVEEQFYLFWPLVILFVSRAFLFYAVLFAVLMGPLFRLLMLGIGLTHFQGSMLMPSHLDTLGIGGLLAILSRKVELDRLQFHKTLNFSFIAGMLILSLVFVSKMLNASSSIEFVLGELGAGLLFLWVIGRAAEGFVGPVGFLLNRPILIYLGCISYGMYINHLFVPDLLHHIGLLALIPEIVNIEWVRFLLFSSVSILIATGSWYIIEKPINGLKRYFPL